MCEKSAKSAAHPISPNEVKELTAKKKTLPEAIYCTWWILYLMDAPLHLTDASQRHQRGSITANPITMQHKQISTRWAISFPILWTFFHEARRQIAKKNTLNNKCWQFHKKGIDLEVSRAWNNIEEAEIFMNY